MKLSRIFYSIPNVKHLCVTDLSLEKGKSPASGQNVEVVVTQARAMLQR